jgi:hypothetical protein
MRFDDYATAQENKKYRFIASLCKNDMDVLCFQVPYARRQFTPYRFFTP